MTTSLPLVGTHDTNVYVGTKVEARIGLTDAWTEEPLTALAPSLTFIDPDGNSHDAGTMTPVDKLSGVYQGFYAPDQPGDWLVNVEIPSPYETFRQYTLYVSPRAELP